MFKANLFLGFVMDEAYKSELDKIPSSLRSLFIQEGKEYLQMIENENMTLLGKFLDEKTDISALDLIYDHLVSLLKCLLPSYSYSKENIILIALPVLESHTHE